MFPRSSNSNVTAKSRRKIKKEVEPPKKQPELSEHVLDFLRKAAKSIPEAGHSAVALERPCVAKAETSGSVRDVYAAVHPYP